MIEYISITLPPHVTSIEELDTILNDIGKEGWQLCAAAPFVTRNTTQPDIMVYTFSRPIHSKSEYLKREQQRADMVNSIFSLQCKPGLGSDSYSSASQAQSLFGSKVQESVNKTNNFTNTK